MDPDQVKIDRYSDLVNAINSFPKDRLDALQLEAFSLCQEVNLWAYWQGGAGHLDAKILLVGQDWGPLSLKGETVVEALRGPSFDRTAFRYMEGNTNPTNQHLCELFEVLGYDVQIDQPELFFTNLIPWYRKGQKATGGFRWDWVERSSNFFAELADIIQPKAILCLGQSVFSSVLFIGKAEAPAYTAYNQAIENGAVRATFKTAMPLVFPLAHCGSYGTMNRNGRKKMPKEERLTLQKGDWQRVSAALEGYHEPP